MKPTILLPSALCLAAGTLATAAQSAPPPPLPNILYFLVDDMGFSDCGFAGGKDFLTPNIDALARKGVIFQNYYVQPLCSASRSTIMTGRMPNRHGIYGAIVGELPYGLPLDERILPQLLKTSGYTSAITGKWHCGHYRPEYRPTSRGWDHQYGFYTAMLDYFTHKRLAGARAPGWFRDDKPLHEEGYTTHLIAREASRLIKQHAATNTRAAATNANSARQRPIENRESKIENPAPLFLYVPFNAVHSPFQVPPEYEKPYANLTSNRRRLGAMLAVVDEAIGQIYAALVETGMADNTLIIFSSDNGGVSPGTRSDNRPLRAGKGTIYEGGIRSAAFVVWPNHIKPNTTAAPPVHLVDWYPTLAAIAGIDPTAPIPTPLASDNPKSRIQNPKSLDGHNILPLLLEGKPPPRDTLLIVGTSPQRYAYRKGDWKLLVNPNANELHSDARRADPDDITDTEIISKTRLELYNLATDIGETKNLAAAEPARLKQMYAEASAIMRDAAPSLSVTTSKKTAKTGKTGKAKKGK